MGNPNSVNNSGGDSANDRWAILQDHGASWGVPGDRIKGGAPAYHVSDRDAVLSEHGGGMGGVPSDRIRGRAPAYHVSDRDAVLNEHGGGMGGVPDRDFFGGVEEQQQKDNINRLTHADWAEDAKGMIKDLPDAAVQKIVERRMRNTENKLEDRGQKNPDGIAQLGRDLYFDLEILGGAVELGKNLSEVNVSNRVGQEDIRDVNGILDAYADAVRNFGVDVPLMIKDEPAVNSETGEPYTALGAIALMKERLNGSSQE